MTVLGSEFSLAAIMSYRAPQPSIAMLATMRIANAPCVLVTMFGALMAEYIACSRGARCHSISFDEDYTHTGALYGCRSSGLAFVHLRMFLERFGI